MAERTRPLNVLFATLAGVGAFYGALQLSARLTGHADAHDAIVEPVVRASRPAVDSITVSQTGADPQGKVDLLPELRDRARTIPAKAGDPFSNLNWVPPVRPAPATVVGSAPPPPPLPPAPAASPTAPPMPFTFVGMLEKGALKPQAFLSKGDALLVVAAGDLLDNKTYRVESLTPQELVMTYLPLNIRQSIIVSGGAK